MAALVAAAAMVGAAMVAEGVEVVVAMAMALTHLTGKTATISVASRGTGPVTIRVNNLRRIKRSRHSWPKRT
jgi:hypothetical protein